MSNTREELELLLGPRENYMLKPGDPQLLREWVIAGGVHPFSANAMTNVELANIYHADAVKPSASSDINALIVQVLEAVNAPGFEVSLTRKIAREEMRKEIISGDNMRGLVQEILDKIAPRTLQVTSPQGFHQIQGYQHYMTEKIIKIVGIGHHVMLVGPAGCGKTFIGEQTAKALGLPFYITSTVSDTHELTGFVDGYGKYHSTPFRNAFEFGGVWVADEIDAWDAAALLAANAALANGFAAFPDRNEPIPCHSGFRLVATANTFGNGANRIYIGRNELDAASLDRFAMIVVDYDMNLERIFSNGNAEWLEYVWKVRKIVNEKKIRHVVSSRAIIKGSQALAAGIDLADVREMYLYKGMSETDREKVETE